jgi:hypothetical protein
MSNLSIEIGAFKFAHLITQMPLKPFKYVLFMEFCFLNCLRIF